MIYIACNSYVTVYTSIETMVSQLMMIYITYLYELIV